MARCSAWSVLAIVEGFSKEGTDEDESDMKGLKVARAGMENYLEFVGMERDDYNPRGRDVAIYTLRRQDISGAPPPLGVLHTLPRSHGLCDPYRWVRALQSRSPNCKFSRSSRAWYRGIAARTDQLMHFGVHVANGKDRFASRNKARASAYYSEGMAELHFTQS